MIFNWFSIIFTALATIIVLMAAPHVIVKWFSQSSNKFFFTRRMSQPVTYRRSCVLSLFAEKGKTYQCSTNPSFVLNYMVAKWKWKANIWLKVSCFTARSILFFSCVLLYVTISVSSSHLFSTSHDATPCKQFFCNSSTPHIFYERQLQVPHKTTGKTKLYCEL